MKIIVEEAPYLKFAIDSIVSLVEEGVFEVKKEGISLKAMDPSQISMVSFHMPKSAFLTYEITDERNLGLDIAQFNNILSRGKKGEKAELSLEDGRLVVCFYSGKSKKTFSIPLLDIGSTVHKEPKIEYKNHVKIHAEAFRESLKDAKLVSSHVKLIILPESFVVDVKGDNGKVRDEFQGGAEVSDIQVSSSEGAKATFPLQYLEDIVKAASSVTPITICLETDKPLKIEYEINGAKAVYYLAPRIESE